MESVTVRVPATTANLAAGFDVLGCALSLYNTLRFSFADTLSFTGCDAVYQNKDNLAVQGFRAVCDRLELPMPGLKIDIFADIPVCRGLGSSAAMLAAGAITANEMYGRPFSKDELLALTTAIEGHPDNLAPAFFGGLTAALLENGRVYTVSYRLHESLRFVAVSPDFPLSTHTARAVLPKQIAFKDAVFNGAHLALLLGALESGDEALLSTALQDRLHQPYRLPLIDEYDAVLSLAAQNGCRAVCISGAGPTLLCLTRSAAFASQMEATLSSLSHRWIVRDLSPDTQGAVILHEPA